MLQRLLGVIEDGINRAADVPLEPRRTLRIPRGVTATIELTVQRPNGSAFDLTGSTVVLTVKKSSLQVDVQPGLKKTGVLVVGQPNLVRFTLEPADTLVLEPGRFVYDAWRTAGDGARDPLVMIAPFILEPTASLP